MTTEPWDRCVARQELSRRQQDRSGREHHEEAGAELPRRQEPPR
jgi:hypothetical protein